MTVAEAKTLLDVRARTGVKICEAFMTRSAPQWLRVRQLIDEGGIGELRAVAGVYSYFNVNPANIRNQIETGGGALYDIGCYLVQSSRYAFQRDPQRVVALVDRDAQTGTDRLTSALLDFGSGHAVFTCSTQQIPCQKIQFLGSRGRIELEIPFNAPNDRPTRLFIDSTGDLTFSGVTMESFPTSDQYTLQGDAFARAVRDNTEVPVPLEDSIGNMAVIEAIFRSGASGGWETVER
jgi:predicted dehydrogenase